MARNADLVRRSRQRAQRLSANLTTNLPTSAQIPRSIRRSRPWRGTKRAQKEPKSSPQVKNQGLRRLQKVLPFPKKTVTLSLRRVSCRSSPTYEPGTGGTWYFFQEPL